MTRWQQQRLSSETNNQRASRIAQNSGYQQARLLSETEDQRALRIAQNSQCQHERIALEMEEKRAKTIARNSHCQQQRLAAETPEDNQRRRHRYANSNQTITIDTSILMMENHFVIEKITEYHSHLSNINLLFCNICHQIQLENCHVCAPLYNDLMTDHTEW
jgi:hypothetical protein